MAKEKDKVVAAEDSATTTTQEVLPEETIEESEETIEESEETTGEPENEIEVVCIASFGSPGFDVFPGKKLFVPESIANDWILHGLAQKV